MNPRAKSPAFRLTCVLLALSLFLLILVTDPSVYAKDLSPNRTRYIRTHIGMENGVLSDVVDDIVQSHDGFLWMKAGSSDLMRFDGQNLLSIPKLDTRSLDLAPNGDLWVGTSHDLKQIPASNLDQLDMGQSVSSYSLRPGCAATVLHFTRGGALWVGATCGLYQFDDGRLLPAIPGPYIERIEEEANGHLWITVRGIPIEWDGAHALPHPELAALLDVKATEIFHVFEDSHGVTWFCTKNGVARRVSGRIEKLQPYGTRGHAAYRIYEDPNRRIWFAKDEGLFQLTPVGLDLVAPGMKVRRMFGDRDGNLWVSTNGDGLYRFKESAVRTYTTADGLPSDVAMTVLTAHDGTLWAGFNCGGIAHFDGHRFRIYNEKDGLLNGCVWSLAEDAYHELWIGTWGGGAFRFHEGKFIQYSKPEGIYGDTVRSVIAARDGSVWLAGDLGISRIRDGQIRNYTSADGLSGRSNNLVFEDHTGRIWVASETGTQYLMGERFQTYSIPGEAAVKLIGEDTAGALYFVVLRSWDRPGVFRLKNNQTIQISADDLGAEVRETKQGDLLLGFVRFPADDFQVPHGASEPIDNEIFGLSDGLPTIEFSDGRPVMAIAPDSKYWIATSKGLVTLDLPRMPRTDRKPVIYVKTATVGREKRTAPRELVLPSGTNHFELDFDAIEITSPEKIRLQYRLDGVDSEWLDATPPGRAIYSTLPPGTHALHMRACNRSGIWDRMGSVYYITQLPYYYQTGWFRAACAVAFLLIWWIIYQLRIQQLHRQFAIGLEARVNERARIARELHDTLLQSFHGLMLQFQAVRNMLPGKPEKAERALDEAILETEQALAEGRDAIRDLRPERVVQRDLADLLNATGSELAVPHEDDGSSPTFSVIVEGEPQTLSLMLQDEVFRIAREAIRNAFRHAVASRIEVEIHYDADQLRLRIRDDGKGIDAKAMAPTGRPGHWGIPGIRERAQRIGSRLEFWSEEGAGTEVELTVPAAIAYEKQRDGHRFRLFRRAGSDGQGS